MRFPLLIFKWQDRRTPSTEVTSCIHWGRSFDPYLEYSTQYFTTRRDLISTPISTSFSTTTSQHAQSLHARHRLHACPGEREVHTNASATSCSDIRTIRPNTPGKSWLLSSQLRTLGLHIPHPWIHNSRTLAASPLSLLLQYSLGT